MADLKAWDPAGFIETEDDAVFYLEASLDEAIEAGDHRILTAALGHIVRARGVTETARTAGLTREGLHRALSESGDPKLSTVVAAMKAVGVRFSPRAA